MRYLILFILIFFLFVFAVGKVTEYKMNKVMESINEKIKCTEERIEKKSDLLAKVFGIDVKDRPVYSMKVTATGYTARKEECDANPEITASGNPSRVGVIAVSRDLEYELGLKMGDMILIPDMGLFRIEDRMNSRWKRRIDILHGNLKAAKLFGTKQVEIIWIGKGDRA